MGDVKVLGFWASPFSGRVEMALKLKGVEYEYIEEDLSNKSPLLLKYNPVHKKVPLLLHNAKPVAESLVILEYIDETWPEGPPILPKDPYERSKARFWARFVEDKCMPAMWKACWSRGEEQEKTKEEAVELLRILDSEIKGKKFFGGDNIGLVDITANFIAYWFGIVAQVVGLDEVITKETHPNLCKWIEEYNNCSFVKENVPVKDKLAEKFKEGIQAAAKSSPDSAS
ncbi:putative glutathione S-transferase [Sesamum alatum]|uniref:Probable glutathione S-transferase n=1 Tax=Sesamum alatum TaxID=300844 RepID=A0AAE1YL08_9LAMI|nr:putative glutathione S-transferase [Sesamum alatum]